MILGFICKIQYRLKVFASSREGGNGWWDNLAGKGACLNSVLRSSSLRLSSNPFPSYINYVNKCNLIFLIFTFIFCECMFCLHVYLCTTAMPGAVGCKKRSSKEAILFNRDTTEVQLLVGVGVRGTQFSLRAWPLQVWPCSSKYIRNLNWTWYFSFLFFFFFLFLLLFRRRSQESGGSGRSEKCPLPAPLGCLSSIS